jgi:hypothetical protein
MPNVIIIFKCSYLYRAINICIRIVIKCVIIQGRRPPKPQGSPKKIKKIKILF